MRSINRSTQPIKKTTSTQCQPKNIRYKVNRNLRRKTDIDKQLMGCDTQLAFGENIQRNCPLKCSGICLREIFLRVRWVQNIWEYILGVMSSRNVWGLGQFWEIFTGRKWPGQYLSREGFQIREQDYKLSLCVAVVIWVTQVNTQIQTGFTNNNNHINHVILSSRTEHVRTFIIELFLNCAPTCK